jgi:hypothetical protein
MVSSICSPKTINLWMLYTLPWWSPHEIYDVQFSFSFKSEKPHKMAAKKHLYHSRQKHWSNVFCTGDHWIQAGNSTKMWTTTLTTATMHLRIRRLMHALLASETWRNILSTKAASLRKFYQNYQGFTWLPVKSGLGDLCRYVFYLCIAKHWSMWELSSAFEMPIGKVFPHTGQLWPAHNTTLP